MDQDREIHISPTQSLHLEVMRSVVKQVQDTPYVLKGGAALIFTRALKRYSTDLDFDSGLKVSLTSRLERAFSELGEIELRSLKLVKDTETVQRYKIHYWDRATKEDQLLKVETSFRDSPKQKAIETISGIKTYRVEYQFDQKLKAAQRRTEARDLYDLDFLVNHYGSQLRDDQIEAIQQFTADLDQLLDQYRSSFEVDEVLSQIKTGEDVVISLHFGVERLVSERMQDSAKGLDSQALYTKFSAGVTQPDLIGVGLIAQNALKAGHSNAVVESMLLRHNPAIKGIVAKLGQENGENAAATLVRGAQIKNFMTVGSRQKQGIQTPDQDGGSSL
ncbi:MAG: nucleotidyl transferase AbiEii/AbiGii toxin family protein [Acaryochloris sp. CRU_2_0]|nr:nucleotidyl transferase AbiEii/AbiGii toxin family protein [Acaryochloris sp. CRU_2_0]